MTLLQLSANSTDSDAITHFAAQGGIQRVLETMQVMLRDVTTQLAAFGLLASPLVRVSVSAQQQQHLALGVLINAARGCAASRRVERAGRATCSARCRSTMTDARRAAASTCRCLSVPSDDRQRRDAGGHGGLPVGGDGRHEVAPTEPADSGTGVSECVRVCVHLVCLHMPARWSCGRAHNRSDATPQPTVTHARTVYTHARPQHAVRPGRYLAMANLALRDDRHVGDITIAGGIEVILDSLSYMDGEATVQAAGFWALLALTRWVADGYHREAREVIQQSGA